MRSTQTPVSDIVQQTLPELSEATQRTVWGLVMMAASFAAEVPPPSVVEERKKREALAHAHAQLLVDHQALRLQAQDLADKLEEERSQGWSEGSEGHVKDLQEELAQAEKERETAQMALGESVRTAVKDIEAQRDHIAQLAREVLANWPPFVEDQSLLRLKAALEGAPVISTNQELQEKVAQLEDTVRRHENGHQAAKAREVNAKALAKLVGLTLEDSIMAMGEEQRLQLRERLQLHVRLVLDGELSELDADRLEALES